VQAGRLQIAVLPKLHLVHMSHLIKTNDGSGPLGLGQWSMPHAKNWAMNNA
jgi:hypothetical protein